eukprot:3893222-Prymnesium_polylepis.1
MILERFPEAGNPAVDPLKGETAGWEALIRVFRRLYDLLADGRSLVYTTSDPAKDERLHELDDIQVSPRVPAPNLCASAHGVGCAWRARHGSGVLGASALPPS